MMHRHRVILILLGLILIGLANHTLGDTEKVNIDSESALKHISGGWYDSQKNSYRPPVLSKPIDDTIRQSGWLGSKKAPSTPRKTTAPWSWSSLGISSELFGWIVFGTLGSVLLFGLLAIAYYYFGDYVPALRRKSSDKDSIKVEELMRLGRYNEAVVYLFGYMLLALDQSRKIHLQKGKTNRMYLREIRSETPLKEIVSKTMLAFEDVFFGRYDIDRARFEMLWAQRDEFHRLIRPVADSEVAPVAKIAPA
jgi:hypothetical protein